MSCSKSKHSIKRSNNLNNQKLKFIGLPIILSLGIFIGYKEVSNAFSSTSEYANQKTIESSKELLESKDAAIQKLINLAPTYPRIYDILKNPSDYPPEFLVMASKKPETIDFVADFPKHKGGKPEEPMPVEGSYTKGEIPLFMQWDERWGYNKYGPDYFAINGCGPTALSMVAVGLTGNENFSPRYIKNFSVKNGYLVDGVGTAWSLMTDGAKKLGIKGKAIPLSSSSIVSNLKKGHPIIATMGPGHFTTEGHYIVLTGVTDGGKIIVNDSDSKKRSSETWDIDVFLKEAKNIWAFSV
ncbi:C39 family peptidase [Paraclostridium ghonii]|uniref:C39 family peptidase n=1 Tax=Paraclostridium ghonii TaxID=29358 RepID=UPI00202CB553|nr:C39 family peptidase [Paeniclostridium ghonii]